MLLHELQLWPFLLPSAFCTGAYDRFSVLYAQRKQPIIMTAECGIFKKKVTGLECFNKNVQVNLTFSCQ